MRNTLIKTENQAFLIKAPRPGYPKRYPGSTSTIFSPDCECTLFLQDIIHPVNLGRSLDQPTNKHTH